MTKAVFTHKPGSIYDDLPEERYHFPAAYRRQVEATVGDFIVYYEPGRTGVDERDRTGRQAYVATAQVIDVRPDSKRTNHFYAVLDSSTYVPFEHAVTFREGKHYYERQLQRDDGKTNKGAFGRAVRPISDQEYTDILRAGFARELAIHGVEPSRADGSWNSLPGLEEDIVVFERQIIERVMSRPVRDAAFARVVQTAYGATCAVTGLKIINGGGRAEAQAAHIRPVQDSGPDSVRNGIALSGTVHWMFDRGLISLGPPPRYDILVTSKGLPENVLRLFRSERRLILPQDKRYWPAAIYLDYHRQTVFKG